MTNKIIISFTIIILLLISGCTSTQHQVSTPTSNQTLNRVLETSKYVNEKTSAEYIILYTNGTCLLYFNATNIYGSYNIDKTRITIVQKNISRKYPLINNTIIFEIPPNKNQSLQIIKYTKY